MNIKSVLLATSLSFGATVTYAQEVDNTLIQNAEYVGTVLGFYDTQIGDTRSETTKYYLGGLPPAAIEECNEYKKILSCGNIKATELPDSTEILVPNFSPSPEMRIGFQTWGNKNDI